MLANIHRNPKKTRTFKPADFHPSHAKKSSSGIKITKGNIGILKALVPKC